MPTSDDRPEFTPSLARERQRRSLRASKDDAWRMTQRLREAGELATAAKAEDLYHACDRRLAELGMGA